MLRALLSLEDRRRATGSRTRLTDRPASSALIVHCALLAVGSLWLCTAVGADEAAARDLATSSGCFKCHGVEKKKDGPALRDVAAKLRGVADAEDKLVFHVTSGEKVKFPDGHEEHHKKVKSTDQGAIRNLVLWILGLEGGTKE